MRRSLLLGSASWMAIGFVCCTALAQDNPAFVAPSDPLTAEEQLTKFHLPPGFAIQLVAAEPDIRKPMNLNFDAQGRLYATQSEEYPYPVRGDKPGRDVVKRFSEFAADGRAGMVETVVEGLNIPIGVTPVDRGGLLFHSIPAVHRVDDADGDGRYDEPRVAYAKFESRDTHGMTNSFTRWIDGWVYATHGYANTSKVRGADGHTITMNSGNTYRMRSDGSRIEQWTHGQVNPFGLTIDPLGNIYTSDCHTKPLYMLLRGGYYPSFGKPDDGLGFAPKMCEHLHGSTGIAGVVYYAADQFPTEYENTMFIGNPVTGCVNHDRLKQHGSTYEAVARSDFITCDDPWFRPVDLQLGPDGALYIADFYNRIIGHYEVPLDHPGRDRERGRIWRVVYTGDAEQPPHLNMPKLADASDEELVALLGHRNLTIRVLATETLAERELSSAVRSVLDEALPGDAAGWRRAHAMWLVERAEGLDGAPVERLFNDPDRLVRVHLLKLLAERPTWSTDSPDTAALVRGKLDDPDPFVRRAAADALGRHPATENLEPLLALWDATPSEDTHQIHVVRMALRDHLLVPGMYERATALADGDEATAERFAELSLGVRNADAARCLAAFLDQHKSTDKQLREFVHDIVRYLPEDELDGAFERLQVWSGASPDRQCDAAKSACRASEERGLDRPAAVVDWADDITAAFLTDDRKSRVRNGIELARDLKLPKHVDRLFELAGPSSDEPSLRQPAMEACLANDAPRTIEMLAVALGDSSEPGVVRRHAINLLSRAAEPAAVEALSSALRVAPAELAVEIARGLATQRAGGEALLTEVDAGRASPRLLRNTSVYGRLVAARVPNVKERIDALTANLPDADEQLAALIAARRDKFNHDSANPTRGREVFRKTCGACHQLGGEGGKIGPGLDGVGLRGLDRLLEDTLDPSRNVDQAFRTTVVATNDGRVISGLALREEGEVLILADAEGKEVRVPLGDVEDRSLSPLSPMPANVGEVVSEQDYFHLLRFLLEQRQPVKQAAGG